MLTPRICMTDRAVRAVDRWRKALYTIGEGTTTTLITCPVAADIFDSTINDAKHLHYILIEWKYIMMSQQLTVLSK